MIDRPSGTPLAHSPGEWVPAKSLRKLNPAALGSPVWDVYTACILVDFHKLNGEHLQTNTFKRVGPVDKCRLLGRTDRFIFLVFDFCWLNSSYVISHIVLTTTTRWDVGCLIFWQYCWMFVQLWQSSGQATGMVQISVSRGSWWDPVRTARSRQRGLNDPGGSWDVMTSFFEETTCFHPIGGEKSGHLE